AGKPDNLYIYIDNGTTNFIPASIVKLSILDVGEATQFYKERISSGSIR
ncbi:unnamed protein product, partial [Onchocerca ochengi]